MVIKKIFEIEKKPRKGLMAFEWAVMAYLLFTLLLIMITYTKLQHPGAMLWGLSSQLWHSGGFIV